MTEPHASITSRLEVYLAELDDLSQQWAGWLRRHETAAVTLNLDVMNSLRQEAEGLNSRLVAMQSNRSALLQDAGRLGLPTGSLKSMARGLPNWTQPSLRQAVMAAQQQLAHLRRLHLSTAVLVHQLAQYFTGISMLLTDGASGSPVYVQAGGADTGGGQLLDTDL